MKRPAPAIIAISVMVWTTAAMWARVALAADADSLDGTYIAIGPVAAAARVDGEWLSAVGLELSVAHVAERAFPAAWGVAGGGVSYGGRAGGRLWLEAEAAIYDPLPVPIGVSLGAAAEVDAVRPPRWGAQATLWCGAALVPFVRAGTVEETGRFIELGIMLKIPARRFR